jgi:anti-anti-sigma regulatory factor
MPSRLLHPSPLVRVTDSSLREDGVGRRLVRLATTSGLEALHLDLGGVTSPTAGVLGQLVRLHKELHARGVGLVLWNVGAYEVFELTRLTEVLDLRPG